MGIERVPGAMGAGYSKAVAISGAIRIGPMAAIAAHLPLRPISRSPRPTGDLQVHLKVSTFVTAMAGCPFGVELRQSALVN